MMIGGVLSERSLVLNKSWVAIATTTVRHALSLVYLGAAQVITPETYETHGFESWASMAVGEGAPCVRTISLHIPVPEVIVLTRYNGLPAMEVTFTRRNLYRRDRNTCQYCGARPGTQELTIDHVLPKSRGGTTSWDNVVAACYRCNLSKGSDLIHPSSIPHEPSYWEMVRIAKSMPLRIPDPQWQDYLQWPHQLLDVIDLKAA